MSPLLFSFDLIFWVRATLFLFALLSQNTIAALQQGTLDDAPKDQAAADATDKGVFNLDKVIQNKESGVMNNDSVVTSSDVSMTPSATTASVVMTTGLEEVATTSNGTIPSGYGADILQNRGMIARMTYVLVGFSFLILVYFVVKAVRLRRVKSRTRKYGVLTENLDSPLRIDDESDEEVEVFEVNGTNLRGGRNAKGGTTASDRLLP